MKTGAYIWSSKKENWKAVRTKTNAWVSGKESEALGILKEDADTDFFLSSFESKESLVNTSPKSGHTEGWKRQ